MVKEAKKNHKFFPTANETRPSRFDRARRVRVKQTHADAVRHGPRAWARPRLQLPKLILRLTACCARYGRRAYT